MSADLAHLRRKIEDAGAADEVDSTDVAIDELQDAGAIRAVAVGTARKIDTLRVRIEERQQLRIIQEEIDVVTFAMIGFAVTDETIYASRSVAPYAIHRPVLSKQAGALLFSR